MPSAMNRRLSHSLPASEHIQLVIYNGKLYVTTLCSKQFKIFVHVEKKSLKNIAKILKNQ
jgi:REP element-mobilizing transposase RayT